MILSHETKKEIERHFYNHQQERLEVDGIKTDIAEQSNYALDISGVHSGNTSDTTMQKAAQIEKVTGRLAKWVSVVTKTTERFRHTPYELFINLVYVEGLSPIRVQDTLYISERTYFDWRSVVLEYAACIAYKQGLIKI